jgi:probable phosphomutase (TIGR03848 family)
MAAPDVAAAANETAAPEPQNGTPASAVAEQTAAAEQAAAPQPPTRILLIRHGINDYVKKGLLAGRTPGVHLNEDGQAQAQAVAERLGAAALAGERIAAVYSSPLERCHETAAPLAERLDLELRLLDDVKETDCGEWTGQALEELRKAETWQQVQINPSGFRFPGGESMLEIQARMVATLDRLSREHKGQTIAIFSHSDPIKLAVAFYAGMPLDLFQRLDVSPASISELDFSPLRVRLVRLNDCAHVPPPRPSEAKEEPEMNENVEKRESEEIKAEKQETLNEADGAAKGALEEQVIRGPHGAGPEPVQIPVSDEGKTQATGG